MMKRAVSLPGSFLLIMIAVTCTMGALISGFQFDAEISMLAIIWGMTALALPMSSLVWRGRGVFFLIPPVLVLIFARMREFTEGAKSVIHLITVEYNKWLYVPLLFEDAKPTINNVTIFLTVAGIILAFLLYITICLRRDTFLTVLFTAPLIMLTFVLVLTQPDPWFLIGILAVYLTLIISNSLHPGNDISVKKKNVYTPLLIVSLILVAAYITMPSGSYQRGENVRSIDAMFRRFAQQTGMSRLKMGVGWPAISAGEVWSFNTENVGIADAGVRNITDQTIMEVNASRPGTYYLRGYSMQHFNGRTWSVNSDKVNPRQDLVAMQTPANIVMKYNESRPVDMQPETSIYIDSLDNKALDIEYMPYHVISSKDTYRFVEYIFFSPDTDVLELARELTKEDLPAVPKEYDKLVNNADTYLQIDEDTSDMLFKIAMAEGIDPYADRAEIAGMVANYMTSFGKYTLSPYVIPDGENFTLYFLLTSKQGYCIHYATAATMMLRALDVPARFASGFVVTIRPDDVDETQTVTDRYAHSWVEVYFDGLGWLPLEVTPPATGTGLSDGRPYFYVAQERQPSGNRTEEPDDMMPDWMMDEYLSSMNDRRPGQSAAQESPDETGPSVWRIVLMIVLGLAVLILALFVYRRVMRRMRSIRFSQEDTNAAVMYVWKYLNRMNRRSRRSRRSNTPEEVERTALKARFSQHRITEEERTDAIGYAMMFASEEYGRRGLFGRMWLKWAHGV